MPQQFDRQYRFSAGKAGSVGFELGEQSRMAIHIYFNVQKADCETANTAKFTLHNLNDEHLAALNEKDCVVTLKAGYGTVTPLIFVGAVTHVETSLDGSDRATDIEAVDGRVELRDTFVSLSYKGKISTKKIFEAIAGEMGVPVTFSHNAQFADLPNGYSFIGAGKAALDKACVPSGLIWEIQNGILQVKRKGDTMTREVYVLAPDSGLVGIPKKLTLAAENGEDAPKNGWELSFLMNGAIGVGDYVKLESKVATGYFRVDTVEHDGDNLSGDWLTTAKIYETTA